MAWRNGIVVGLVLALACDIYLRLRALRRERALARTDDGTGLDNRQAFFEAAGREFERARRYGHPFTLAYFDLDDFREVSDDSGPEVGREMLRLVAHTVRRAIRASDVVASLGGGQLALLLPEAGPDAAETVIRKLQQKLREASKTTGLPVTISGGMLTCLQPTDSLEAVINAADRLLHGAKHAGKDTVWREVVTPQPLEGFEPARVRRPSRLPPAFDIPLPPLER